MLGRCQQSAHWQELWSIQGQELWKYHKGSEIALREVVGVEEVPLCSTGTITDKHSVAFVRRRSKFGSLVEASVRVLARK